MPQTSFALRASSGVARGLQAGVRINAVLGAVAIVTGAGLVLLTLFDLALTTLHVQSESPFSTRINRAVWSGLSRSSGLAPEPLRDEMLGWALPLMIGATMAAWALGYILGFALLLLPQIHDPTSFATQHPRSDIEDALFFSGLTFFSLGANEITPVAAVPRALAVLEGAAGLLTISLAVTYLLNVYPVISRKAAFADVLNQATGGRSDGVLAAHRYIPEQRYEALANRLEHLNDELLYLAHAHRLYPVLYYVRSREAHESFARILAVGQGLVATLRYGLDPDSYPDVVRDPRLLMLEEGLLDTLHLLARSSHLSVPGTTTPEEAAHEFTVLREQLIEHGLRPMRADEPARQRYTRFQQATEPYIRAYGLNIGYPIAAVWDTYDRAARNTDFVDSGASGRLAATAGEGVERDGQQQHSARDHELHR
jgi:Ion channel